MKQNLVLNICLGDMNSDYTAFHRRYIHISSDSLDGIYPTQDLVSWVGLYDAYDHDDRCCNAVLLLRGQIEADDIDDIDICGS